ncbi:MAG: IucA/IucC family siderophore biosynthesis protein, partial [Myxococcales bacterium]|nr:IucA/IucC family siderophore biosynthesis protein [Myxococcales bacterium]
ELGKVRLKAEGDLPEKSAILSVCTREAFELQFDSRRNVIDPDFGDASGIDVDAWGAATRGLVAKAIGELSHERMIKPLAKGAGKYRIIADRPGVEYTFEAKRFGLDHWEVEPLSVQRLVQEKTSDLGGQEFILDFRTSLAIPDSQMMTYLEEVNATLLGDAYKILNERWDSRSLVRAGMLAIEASMTAGHPCFIANNARLGFDIRERTSYAPESGKDIHLVWVALSREQAQFWHVDEEVDQRSFLERELPESDRERFYQVLRHRGVDPEDYLWIPVHPWQWENLLVTAYARELAQGRMIYLGQGVDSYQPQQSIRTLFNRSYPTRHYVKCSLSILNMGFYRGLSSKYMSVTPAINQWVAQVVERDEFLGVTGFGVLRELAAIGAHQPLVQEAAPPGHHSHKLLASLWRESPMTKVRPGQSLATMASLLHIDKGGKSFIGELIRSSGRNPEEWIKCYLIAYMAPLIHCFYAHDMVFMPHGENIILVLEEHTPVGVFIKDIGEEVCLFSRPDSLPEKISRIVVDVKEPIRLLSIFTDVFDCFFRFLVPILDEQLGVKESVFWKLVADVIHNYQDQHPEYGDKFALFDLFRPSFALSCLNRLQFANNQQLIDLSDPGGALQLAGELTNPVAVYRKPQPSVVGAKG